MPKKVTYEEVLALFSENAVFIKEMSKESKEGFEKLRLQTLKIEEENAKGFKEVWDMFKKSDEEFAIRQAQSEKEFKELWDMFKKSDEEFAIRQAQSEKEFKEVWDMFKKSDEEFAIRQAQSEKEFKELRDMFKKTDAQIEKSDKKLQGIAEQFGGLSHNVGDFAEEYFANALEDKKIFAGQKFDDIERDMKAKYGSLKDQFDIVMYNCSSVAIVEVKFKLNISYLEKMVSQKVSNFRTLFPYYKDHKIYLGIGSMSFYDDVIEKAKELGIGILRQKGETIEIDPGYVKAY
ncbi:MAG: hypothetical protein Ta2F_02690 [Termitinemataceae bacterium]|nr:MAG: hypothetical protein Ta2F_02690 [Termitinemataceae bacterium]